MVDSLFVKSIERPLRGTLLRSRLRTKPPLRLGSAPADCWWIRCWNICIWCCVLLQCWIKRRMASAVPLPGTYAKMGYRSNLSITCSRILCPSMFIKIFPRGSNRLIGLRLAGVLAFLDGLVRKVIVLFPTLKVDNLALHNVPQILGVCEKRLVQVASNKVLVHSEEKQPYKRRVVWNFSWFPTNWKANPLL